MTEHAEQASYLDPPPLPARGARPYQSREWRRLAVGVHPSGLALLGPAHESCGSCGHRLPVRSPAGVAHNKCALAAGTWTVGRATDVLLRWPACERWVPDWERPTTGEEATTDA